jgi:uncharacterized protein
MSRTRRFGNLVEWNDVKAHANGHKHGISFEVAQSALQDPNALMLHDRIDAKGKDRWKTIGRAASHLVLLVVYVLQQEHPEEAYRILSARRASKWERQSYEKRVFDTEFAVSWGRRPPKTTFRKKRRVYARALENRAWGRRTEIQSVCLEAGGPRNGSARRLLPRPLRVRRSTRQSYKRAAGGIQKMHFGTYSSRPFSRRCRRRERWQTSQATGRQP